MSRWVETEDGNYVNLAHVIKAENVTRKDRGMEWNCHRLTFVDGSTVKTRGVYSGWEDFDAISATIIPAHSGQEALTVSWDETARPTELWIARYPIIGWRIRGHFDPLPVLPDKIAGMLVLIVLPDGRLLEQGSGEYDNVEQMTGTVLATKQSEWDQKHEPAAA
jgi:hypothetical protein